MKTMDFSRHSVSVSAVEDDTWDGTSLRKLEPLRKTLSQMQSICKSSQGDHRAIQLPDSVCETLFGLTRRCVIDNWHYRFFTESYTNCTYECVVRLAEKVVDFLCCCATYRIDRSSIEGAHLCTLFESLLNAVSFEKVTGTTEESTRLVHFSEIESEVRDCLPNQVAFNIVRGIYEETYSIVLKIKPEGMW